jgi:hypothetical protein
MLLAKSLFYQVVSSIYLCFFKNPTSKWIDLVYHNFVDVPEGSFIVRAHTPMSNLFSCLWFNEVNRFTSRDQLSFTYTYLKLRRMNTGRNFHLNMFKVINVYSRAFLFLTEFLRMYCFSISANNSYLNKIPCLCNIFCCSNWLSVSTFISFVGYRCKNRKSSFTASMLKQVHIEF